MTPSPLIFEHDPHRHAGFLAATRKVKPQILDLTEQVLEVAHKAAAKAGKPLGEWVGEAIIQHAKQ